jgi:hypothetical protein
MGPRADLHPVGKRQISCARQEPNPAHPVHSPVAILTGLSRLVYVTFGTFRQQNLLRVNDDVIFSESGYFSAYLFTCSVMQDETDIPSCWTKHVHDRTTLIVATVWIFNVRVLIGLTSNPIKLCNKTTEKLKPSNVFTEFKYKIYRNLPTASHIPP